MTDDFEQRYREAVIMGDLMMRISLLVQRGGLCQCCGCEMAGDMTGSPRSCSDCDSADSPLIQQRDQPATGTRDSPKRSASSA